MMMLLPAAAAAAGLIVAVRFAKPADPLTTFSRTLGNVLYQSQVNELEKVLSDGMPIDVS